MRTNAPLLHPAANNLLAMYPVSPYVNKPANEGPECIAPLEEDTGLSPGE